MVLSAKWTTYDFYFWRAFTYRQIHTCSIVIYDTWYTPLAVIQQYVALPTSQTLTRTLNWKSCTKPGCTFILLYNLTCSCIRVLMGFQRGSMDTYPGTRTKSCRETGVWWRFGWPIRCDPSGYPLLSSARSFWCTKASPIKVDGVGFCRRAESSLYLSHSGKRKRKHHTGSKTLEGHMSSSWTEMADSSSTLPSTGCMIVLQVNVY